MSDKARRQAIFSLRPAHRNTGLGAMTDILKIDRQDGLLVLTLNRPERRNALNRPLAEALCEATAAAAADPAVRAVLLTGAGGQFCVGGDIVEMEGSTAQGQSAEQRLSGLRDRMEAARHLHDMPKPTVAAIEGACAGAGFSLAMACDMRICAENAKFTTAFAKMALSGDYGGTCFVTRALGAARARELFLAAPVLSGREAAALGLVMRAAPADALQDDARTFAAGLAAGPTEALARIKQNIALAEAGGTLTDCLDREAKNHLRCAAGEDHKEAAAAFIQKRKPTFAGR